MCYFIGLMPILRLILHVPIFQKRCNKTINNKYNLVLIEKSYQTLQQLFQIKQKVESGILELKVIHLSKKTYKLFVIQLFYYLSI